MKNDFNLFWPGWDIENPIGRGSFGTVYRITRDVYGDIEEAALKIISIPQNEDEVDYLRCTGMDEASITQSFHQQVGDIAREYKLMARMRENPNIVRCDDFRDVQHDDGLGWDIYIKMELLTPLMKALDRVKTENEIIRLGKELCNALITCQEYNIIHRDIKPQNVFISDRGVFKLGDFGIARTVERTTRATAGIGTYNFMAPEVMRNEAYGKTADIYSLGLLLHWLLNERRSPFMPLPPVTPKYGDEDKARQRRFSGEAIPAPLHGSENLKRIVLKACAFDPKDRYASAEEMLTELEALGISEIMVEPYVNSAQPQQLKPDMVSVTDNDYYDTVGVWGAKAIIKPTIEKREVAVEASEDVTVGLWASGNKEGTEAKVGLEERKGAEQNYCIKCGAQASVNERLCKRCRETSAIEQSMVKCPHCLGTKVQTFINSSGFVSRYYDDTCSVCNGTGEIKYDEYGKLLKKHYDELRVTNKSKSEISVDCPVCHGLGSVFSRSGMPFGVLKMYQQIKCPMCYGKRIKKGRISK